MLRFIKVTAIVMATLLYWSVVSQAAADAPCMSYAAATDSFRAACAEFVKTHPAGDVAPRPDKSAKLWITCPSGVEIGAAVARVEECNLGPGSNVVGRQLAEEEIKCLRHRMITRECVAAGYSFCDAKDKNCGDIDRLPCRFEGGVMKCGAAVDSVPQTPVATAASAATSKGDNCAPYETSNPIFFRKCREFMATHPGGLVQTPPGKRVSLQIVCPPDSGTGTSEGEVCGLGPLSNRIGTNLTPTEIGCIKAPNLTTDCIVAGYLFCDSGVGCVNEKLPCMFTEGKLKCMDEHHSYIED